MRVIAVTKGFGPEAVAAARAAGLTDLGENYAGELAGQGARSGRGRSWHFLGTVQRNKVRRAGTIGDLWQGVARLAEGERIARYAPGARRPDPGRHQRGLPGRNGCPPATSPALAGSLSALDLRRATA